MVKSSAISVAIFLEILKGKARENGNNIAYSGYEILLGHVWRYACKTGKLDANYTNWFLFKRQREGEKTEFLNIKHR